MSLPYGFISLADAQLQRRRHLLDFYGQAAQWSALLALLSYQLRFLVPFLLSKLRPSPQKHRKEHASPIVSSFEDQPLPSKQNQISTQARFHWFLDQHVSWGAQTSSYWGTWRVILTASGWLLWLSVLAVKDTGDDYLHLTKRFGIIAASQLPLHYMLALKSSWSPITYLTRLTHEELNPYHRALGRIILIFLSLHASFYLNFFIQKSLLAKRIRDPDVILGLLAITTFLTLGTTALAWVRPKNYFLFFLVHVTASVLILPILYFHVSHLRTYIIESATIYLILIVQRNTSVQKTPNAKLTQLSHNLLSITIPLTPSLSNSKSFHPGQHIYLSLPSQTRLRLNPFTIANLPQKDTHIRLVLRALNGTTRILANTIPSAPSKPTTIPLNIEGPYGAAVNFPNLATCDRILLVAGGVGATFTVPIYRHLIEQEEGLHTKARTIKFVWAVKSIEDAEWAFPYLDAKDMDGIELYVSSSSNSSSSRATPSPNARVKEDEDEGMELQEREGLLMGHDGVVSGDSSPPSPSSAASTLPPNLTTYPHRPNLQSIVNKLFATHPEDPHPPTKIAVLVCGPAGMGAALRREVGVWVRGGREVWWHNEQFGW
ncbi:MAG: hypothetical protein LQ339_005876 [Xanthoria mediterranea]|nr:MAG: hypothetical protein LQ339_005876 [Xanthoria mediterranea]